MGWFRYYCVTCHKRFRTVRWGTSLHAQRLGRNKPARCVEFHSLNTVGPTQRIRGGAPDA